MNRTPTANIEVDLTQQHFAATWLANAVRNMQRHEVADLETIQNYLDVDRAIICGTGPSLDWDIPRLSEIAVNEKETLIVSNHSNTATLLANVITPDLVVITDSQEPTYLRMKRDVLPHFKGQMKRRHTKFILPTHANPELVDLLYDYNMPVFFFNMTMREDPADPMRKFYNDVLQKVTELKIRTFCLMVGSVSNASVLVCNALKLLHKVERLEDVILSGVDYSYPNGFTRCSQVTWNAEDKDFDVEQDITFLGPEIRKVKYNGLLTSEDQVAYYKDLRFIYWNLIEADPDSAPFRLSTSQLNFIADFLPVQAI